MDHPKRAAILDAIRTQPGIHFRAIVELTYAAGTVAHHLRILQRRGYIWNREYGNRLFYFPTGIPSGVDALELAAIARHALDDTSRRIVQALHEAGPCVQKALLAHPGLTGIPRSSVQHHARKLVETHVLVARWSGRFCQYALADGVRP